MLIAYFVVTAITIGANAAMAAADLVRSKFVLANSAEVGVAESWLPLLGSLKAAGAAGLLLGLLGVHAIGLAAAAGLVVFFAGAIVTHMRARVFHNIAFPGTFFGLSVAALALNVTHL